MATQTPSSPHMRTNGKWTSAGPVGSSIPEEELRSLQGRAEVSSGDPAAMALFGFAVGTLLLALPISGFAAPASIAAAVPSMLVFAGVALFIGGLVAYRKDHTFAATAFCVYGAHNTLLAMFFLLNPGGVTAATGLLIGIEMFCFAYISLVLAIAAIPVSTAYVGFLASLVPGYGLAAVAMVGGPAMIGNIGGYLLFLAAGFALYIASAVVVNSSFQRKLLPMTPRG